MSEYLTVRVKPGCTYTILFTCENNKYEVHTEISEEYKPFSFNNVQELRDKYVSIEILHVYELLCVARPKINFRLIVINQSRICFKFQHILIATIYLSGSVVN